MGQPEKTNGVLADIYLFAGLVCRLFGLKRLSKRLKEKGDALLERCTAEIEQARREQEAREEKARKHREEAIRLERQKCFADPERNTQDWDLHWERLHTCKASRYDGCSYYVGPRGGVYYINYRGRKTYC